MRLVVHEKEVFGDEPAHGLGHDSPGCEDEVARLGDTSTERLLRDTLLGDKAGRPDGYGPADQLGMNQREMNRAIRLAERVLYSTDRNSTSGTGPRSSRGREGQQAMIRAGGGRPYPLQKTGLWLVCSPYQPVVVRGNVLLLLLLLLLRAFASHQCLDQVNSCPRRTAT
ncbi:hypothetical protein LA080_013330 [Diaporthe eres]|nr:hypothetical protein LA080_013330 [Diaporthe eres]